MRRRIVTVPTVLAAAAVAAFGLPVIAPGLVLVDAARARFRLPLVRVYLFTLQYLINDTVEILVAPVYWVAAGLGTRLDSPGSLARHRRLQEWSIELLARRADRLLGLPLEIDDASRSALTPGPAVVISRHASVFDASLPGLVYGRAGFRVRGVIMAEMLADPGFDLLYGRLGSVFIARDDGAAARADIEAMAESMRRNDGPDTAVVLFPEGRLFRPSVRDRALTRLTEVDPDRARRLSDLTRVLPPRPGGLQALLAALPGADVVLLDHRGLDGLGGLGDLVAAVPVDHPVTVTARRFARSSLPQDRAGLTAWLDDRWLELDAALRSPGPPPARPRSG